jgi:hypothetical protein
VSIAGAVAPAAEEETPLADTTADTAVWTAASERLREVIKWVAVSFGAVGALLIGTAPLSSISQAEFGGPLVVAVLAGVAALSAVGLIFWQAISLLAPNPLTLSQFAPLAPRPNVGEQASSGGRAGHDGRWRWVVQGMTSEQRGRLTAAAAQDNVDLLGSYGKTLPDFVAAHRRAREQLAVFDEQWRRGSGTLSDDARALVLDARSKLVLTLRYSAQVRTRVLAWADYWVLADNFRMARPRMFAAALVAAVGITSFHIAAKAAAPSAPGSCTSSTTETRTGPGGRQSTETTKTEVKTGSCSESRPEEGTPADK